MRDETRSRFEFAETMKAEQLDMCARLHLLSRHTFILRTLFCHNFGMWRKMWIREILISIRCQWARAFVSLIVTAWRYQFVFQFIILFCSSTSTSADWTRDFVHRQTVLNCTLARPLPLDHPIDGGEKFSHELSVPWKKRKAEKKNRKFSTTTIIISNRHRQQVIQSASAFIH